MKEPKNLVEAKKIIEKLLDRCDKLEEINFFLDQE